MAKKKKQGGRTTPKGTRPPDRRRAPDDTPPIVHDAIDACADPAGPLHLLSLASMVAETTVSRADDEVDAGDALELFESFLDSGIPAMQRMAAAVSLVHPDPTLRHELTAMVPASVLMPTPGSPRWIASMADVEVLATEVHLEPLRDGDNLVATLRWSCGQDATLVVFVDNNLHGAARDGFVVPIGRHQFEQLMVEHNDPDLQRVPISAADFRARAENAIALGDALDPPSETEAWPGARPLIEWVLSLLPDGGVVEEWPSFTDAELDAIVSVFLATDHAVVDGLTREQVAQLTAALVGFAVFDGPGDPLRWSPSAVDIVLGGWAPAVIDDIDVEVLSRLPDVLEGFVRHAHQVRGIRDDLTVETLDVLQQMRPLFATQLAERDT